MLTIPETGQKVPWKSLQPKDNPSKTKLIVDTHFVCAATLLFTSKRLNFNLPKGQANAALNVLLKCQKRCGAWPSSKTFNESSVEATAIVIHALVFWKPNGWKEAIRKASNWLWSMQTEAGVWSEPSAPDEVHLTVLVLDALELAAGGRKVTFDFSRSKVKPSKARHQYDAFISHATEEKLILVRPLAKALAREGLRIWYDEFELKIGDSLRESIDKGLAKSAFGIVVLSKAFFAKRWTRYELNGLVAKEMDGKKLILPVWHAITKKQILKHSPTLADKRAGMSEWGVKRLARELASVIRI